MGGCAVGDALSFLKKIPRCPQVNDSRRRRRRFGRVCEVSTPCERRGRDLLCDVVLKERREGSYDDDDGRNELTDYTVIILKNHAGRRCEDRRVFERRKSLPR